MTLPRFWIEPPLSPGRHRLPETEAHHLRNVLRLKVGDAIEVFDGTRRHGCGRLLDVGKRQVWVEIETVREEAPPRRRVIVATAVPKGERADWLIEKGTELGIHELIPLRTSRSTVDPRDHKLDRWRQQAIAACKQSGRNDLPTIHPVCDYATFLQRGDVHQQTWWLAHPGGESWAQLQNRITAQPPEHPLLVAVGPEGGWTDAEVTAGQQAGATLLALGSQILRIETAVIAIGALATSLPEPSPAAAAT